MANKRSATYVRTLVYMDEPQVILLKSFKTNVVAVAIPSVSAEEARFVATTVTSRDMESYNDGHVDLRYLFVYPRQRQLFTFDLMKMADNKVLLLPLETEIPEEHLPSPRFFSTSHTEDAAEQSAPAFVQKLEVDGEWDMPDFGDFYGRYSDVYYFLSASHSFGDETVEFEKKRQIKETFVHTPFKGGFSYVNFFKTLPLAVPKRERLRMDKIRYESPGYVDVNGDGDTFEETESIIRAFLANRAELRKLYDHFHSFLSKSRYLQMAASDFSTSDPAHVYIEQLADTLAEKLNIPNILTIKSLVENNPLAFAKIILSLFRRLDEAARFFAQGRVNFT